MKNDDLTIMDTNDDYVNDWVGLIYDYKDSYDDDIEFKKMMIYICYCTQPFVFSKMVVSEQGQTGRLPAENTVRWKSKEQFPLQKIIYDENRNFLIRKVCQRQRYISISQVI